MPELKAALLLERGREHELALTLAKEQGQAEKLSQSYSRAARRFDAKVKALARQNMTGELAAQEQYDRLGRDLGRIRDLARERGRAEAEVQASAQALERVRSNVQALERALALAMAQARTLAREQAQARSPRLRAIAITRFIWRLLQGRSGLWDGIVRSLYLGMRVVGLLVWMLPKADRTRWKDESFSELQDLKMEGVPLLGDAFRIAARTPWLALVLWTGAWRRSSAARWLPRLKPLWIGAGDGGCGLSGRCRRDRSVPNRVSDEGARGRLVDYRRTGRDRVIPETTSSQTQAQALNREESATESWTAASLTSIVVARSAACSASSRSMNRAGG